MKTVLAILALAATFTASTTPTTAAPAKERRVTLTVTKKGFEPAAVRLKAGQPVKLVVTRRVERTCATEIVIKDLGINKPLPLNKTVEVAFTPKRSGTLRYACAMDMIAGSLIVE